MKIIPNMPAREYHAHPAVSKSVLDKMARSPLHARAYLDGMRDEPTPAMLFGTALHAAVLEPVAFANEYAVFDGDRRTRAGKDAYEAILSSGATVISRGDYDAIRAMALSIRQHPVAGKLFAEGVAEHSVFWDDADTGLACKCRPDWWTPSSALIVDLKTTEDASPEAFARSVMNYRYHVQAAHYMTGAQAERFLFVAVEKKAPYAVAVYELDEDALNLGHTLRERDLHTYSLCQASRVWPGYSTEVETLSLPEWAFPKTEEAIEVQYV